MFNGIRKFFTKNTGLKIGSLIIAMVLWFYIVDELNKGTEEERQLLNQVLPKEDVVAKKLAIRPMVIGKPRFGYAVDVKKAMVNPEYCIVVGTRELLGKIKFAYTMPVDMSGATKTITSSVALSPIAPGVYMEETFVQVTVPVEKESS